MLKARRRQLQLALPAADAAMTAAAFLAAYALSGIALTRGGMRAVLPLKDYAWVPVASILMWWLLFAVTGRYSIDRLRSAAETARRLLWPMVLGALILGFAIFALKEKEFARRVIGAFVLLNYMFVLAGRQIMTAWVRRLGPLRNLLLVGSPDTARAFARDALAEGWGLAVLGIVSNRPDAGDAEPTVLGRIDALPRLLDEWVVDDVVIVDAPGGIEGVQSVIRACELVGVSAHVDGAVFGLERSQLGVEALREKQLFSFSTTPHEPVLLAVKRAVDLAVSGTVLLVFWPLLLLIALGVKLTSRGPVFFVQKRVGLNGRTFRLCKYRSMVADAESLRDGLADGNIMDGPVFKMPDDPRVTPLGRLMRRFYVDEIPQLWNVLKGDMSLVGPRPPLPSEVPDYERWQRRRLSMRPGMTGLWQVSGRHRLTFEEWMRCDLAYIDRWSLGRDLAILLRTVGIVLRGKGM